MTLHVRVEAPPDPEALEALAEGLVRLNQYYLKRWLSAGVDVPWLYESGAVYRRETPGEEWWETASDVLGIASHLEGDCEDMANFRTAELRVRLGENARTRVVPTKRGSFHAIVQRGDGSMEDPSRILIALERERESKR